MDPRSNPSPGPAITDNQQIGYRRHVLLGDAERTRSSSAPGWEAEGRRDRLRGGRGGVGRAGNPAGLTREGGRGRRWRRAAQLDARVPKRAARRLRDVLGGEASAIRDQLRPVWDQRGRRAITST